MHWGKVSLPVWMMCWRELKWSEVYWWDAGKRWRGAEARWGGGWNEKASRARMDRPGVFYGKEDEKRLRWFPSSWSEYLKRQWCLGQDSRGWLSQERRMRMRTCTSRWRVWMIYGALKRGEDHSLIYPFNTSIEYLFYARLWQGTGEQDECSACLHKFYSWKEQTEVNWTCKYITTNSWECYEGKIPEVVIAHYKETKWSLGIDQLLLLDHNPKFWWHKTTIIIYYFSQLL